ncbi:NAD-dependent epimerase/dehydratase family protein [Spongisporangium articulatum]|uniref:NAD-dependent epimerase/dehydratase family protein n=1 Tax=Spongisporangium articulatum TaxID=3362603 RepID=A0ABW8APC4_9ACTN
MTTLPGSQEVPVLITGAAGRIGRMIRPLLADAGWDVTCVDVAPGGDAAVQELDVLDGEGLDAATVGCGAVVHLAGIAREAPLPDILRANVEGTQAVLDAALRRGIRRVVLASSNHAVGFCARPESGSLPVDVPVRPDTFYGMSKVAVEALGQLYSDRFGLEVVSLRIGTCLPEPTAVRELSTWLSPGDAARLVAAALTGPVVGHVIAYGISANTRGWWDLSSARALGYEPEDDSESFADRVPPEPAPRVPRTGTPVPPAPERVGGLFTLMPLGGLSSGFSHPRPSAEPPDDPPSN